MFVAETPLIRGNAQVALNLLPAYGDLGLTDLYDVTQTIKKVVALKTSVAFGGSQDIGPAFPVGTATVHIEWRYGSEVVASGEPHTITLEGLETWSYPSGRDGFDETLSFTTDTFDGGVYPVLVIESAVGPGGPITEDIAPWLDCFGTATIYSEAVVAPAVDEALINDLRALYSELVADPLTLNDRRILGYAQVETVAANGERSYSDQLELTTYGMVKYMTQSAASRALGRPTGERVVQITIPYEAAFGQDYVYDVDGQRYSPIPGENNIGTSYRVNTQFLAKARS